MLDDGTLIGLDPGTNPVAQERACADRSATLESCTVSDVVAVPIQDDVIRLGQFLKLAGLIDSGSEAKLVIASGKVRVNDEVEVRRGRQLRDGDVVAVAGRRVRVTSC